MLSSSDQSGAAWERTIVARLLAGDDRALADVYASYGGYVYGLARRVTKNEQAAQDITQDVFGRLWERPDAVDLGRGSLRAFLGTLCHRRSVDLVRREERRRARDQRVGQFAEPAADPAEDATVMVMSAAVRARVDELPVKLREALHLAYFEGMSYREVARHLDIPEGTAKSRLRLALAGLADMLQSEKLEAARSGAARAGSELARARTPLSNAQGPT